MELHSDRRLASQAKPRDICLWNVSKGFKSGGFDGRPINGISAPTAFNPKKGTTCEVGSKLDLLDRHLRFNTALFYRDYDDVHVQVVQTIKGITVNEKNADKARIKGIEVEATLISANAAAEYTIDLDAIGGASARIDLQLCPDDLQRTAE